jgi:hypothetical protein
MRHSTWDRRTTETIDSAGRRLRRRLSQNGGFTLYPRQKFLIMWRVYH